MGSRVNDGVWRFGNAEFDEARAVLSVGGRTVEIDRNCAAVLALLLREAGRDVEKQRLLQAGWSDRIVHENSLAKAISRLRQALGSQGPLLETVYGFGYRLSVDVRPPATRADQAPQGPVAPPEPIPRGRLGRSPGLLAAAALLAFAGLVAISWGSLGRSDGAAEFRSSPPKTGDAPDSVGRLLWVDDHPQNNIFEKRFFEDHRIAVHNVTSSVDAFRLLAMYDYTVVISDMGRGEDRLAGIRLAEQMRSRGDRTPLIIYTVRPDGDEAQRSQRQLVAEAGAQGVVVTPQETRSVVLKLFGNPARRPPS
jgi:DNA-binding response OmpR family regulator